MILVCDISIYCMVLHVYYYKSIQMETCIFEAPVPDFEPPPPNPTNQFITEMPQLPN